MSGSSPSSASTQTGWGSPEMHRLLAGDLEAEFIPCRGMLGASLRHRGEELLRRVDDLPSAATKGSTAGIPLLHPWANRLAGPGYRAGDKEVGFDPHSRLLHWDSQGLPMHGVAWPQLKWTVTSSSPVFLQARLDWAGNELLAVFPFPHEMEMTVTLDPTALTLATRLTAGPAERVPVSFGFHPFLGIPGLPRDQWRLKLPPMRRLMTDSRGIPTGKEESFAGLDGPLGSLQFDDGFAVLGTAPAFSLSGAGRCLTVEFLEGYPYAQIYAPPGKDQVAMEPMTAPTNALVSGQGLRWVRPGATFRAVFRIRVGTEGGARG